MGRQTQTSAPEAAAPAIETPAEALVAAQFRVLPLAEIHESSLNPRRHFDEKRLAELAASVRTHGVLTPILVRPNAAGYEIAAGHRRYRAAIAAACIELPAMIRPMTDAEFLEVLTIENLQREDVHPIEEADGYRALMETAGYDVETIAFKVGKSASYVYQRLKLAELLPELKTIFLDGKITAGHAILIARLRADDQREVLKEGLFERQRERYNQRTEKYEKIPQAAVSVRALDAWIRDEIFLDLSSATWKKDDATLLAGAGACTTCPKRTGANGQLFDDVAKGDNCLDAECFHQKRDNHMIRVQKEAQASGTPLVKIAREYSPEAEKKGDVLRQGSYHLISGKNDRCDYVERGLVAVGAREVGKLVDICRTKACKKHGSFLYGSSTAGEGTKKTFATLWADRRKKLEERIRLEAKRELWRQLVADVPEEFNRFEMDLVGRRLIDRAGHDGRQTLCGALGLEGIKNTGQYASGFNFEAPLTDYMKGLKDADMPGFLVGLALCGALTYGDKDFDGIAKEYRIDKKKVESAVAKPLLEDFEKRKAKAAAGQAKAKKKAGKGAKAAVGSDGASVHTSAKPETKAAAGKTKGTPGKTKKAKGGAKAAAGETAVRTCRACGCTDNDCSGCIERTGEPCHWVEIDLCSACRDEVSGVLDAGV